MAVAEAGWRGDEAPAEAGVEAAAGEEEAGAEAGGWAEAGLEATAGEEEVGEVVEVSAEAGVEAEGLVEAAAGEEDVGGGGDGGGEEGAGEGGNGSGTSGGGGEGGDQRRGRRGGGGTGGGGYDLLACDSSTLSLSGHQLFKDLGRANCFERSSCHPTLLLLIGTKVPTLLPRMLSSSFHPRSHHPSFPLACCKSGERPWGCWLGAAA